MIDDILENIKSEWIIGQCLPHIIRSLEATRKGYCIQTLLALNFETQFDFLPEQYEALFELLKKKFIVFGNDIPVGHLPYMQYILRNADKNRINSQITFSDIDCNDCLKDALAAIKKIDEESHEVILKYMLCIISVKFAKFQSTSLPRMLGAIFLNVESFNNEADTAIAIIHETAHQELFLINMMDPLVEQSSKNEFSYSSLQETERPPIGRLHSCHALYRMIKFQGQDDSPVDELKVALENTLRSFRKTSLTEVGKKLVDSIYPSVI